MVDELLPLVEEEPLLPDEPPPDVDDSLPDDDEDEVAAPHEPVLQVAFAVHVPAAVLHESESLLPLALPEQLRLEPSYALPLSDTLVPSTLPEMLVPAEHLMDSVQPDCVAVHELSWHEPLTEYLPLKSLLQLPPPPPPPDDVPLQAATSAPRPTTARIRALFMDALSLPASPRQGLVVKRPNE